jgi:hypothetical protein
MEMLNTAVFHNAKLDLRLDNKITMKHNYRVILSLEAPNIVIIIIIGSTFLGGPWPS